MGDVWMRPGLTPRDRSIVTLAALIARNQTVELSNHLNLVLDNSVEPREISELITHLAFYSGWGNALSAVAIAKDVFAQRGIEGGQLPPAGARLLPIDETAEARRAAGVSQQFSAVVPGVVQYTTDVLFRDLWLRPDLAGAAGSVIAGRLAENPACDVLLIEADGSDEAPSVLDPSQWPLNLGSERDWGFQAEPNPHLDGRALSMSMGKGLGRGSSVNVMVWARSSQRLGPFRSGIGRSRLGL
jgi:hypothetical protein